jgi:peptide/nickel transport system permease protein
MMAFLVRRVLLGCLTVVVVTTATFALLHAAPGEPFAALLEDPRFTPERRAAFRARYGLDAPLPVQFARYAGGLARGDLGESFTFQRPVRLVIGERLPGTLLLMGTALGLGFALGIVVGARQAARAGSAFDRWTERVTVVIGALPDFWVALAALLLFAFTFRWFPVTGMVDPSMHEFLSPWGKFKDVLWHLVLPASTLGLIVAAAVARYQRQATLDVLPEDFVRTAWAKGLSRRLVMYRHALRNALLPTITLFGLSLPALVGGSVFVESIFAWPGIGRLAVNAISERDYPMVLGVTFVASVLVVLGSIVSDLVQAWADPRARHG